jgi:hypothetical protein
MAAGFRERAGRIRWPRVLAEAAAMVSPLVVSDLLGRFALSSEQTAFVHAEQLARLEHALGLDVEHWFTAVVAAHPTLHAVATGYYATAVAVVLAVAHLVVMVLVILATGHHYALDAVAGAADLGVGLALAVVGHRLVRRWYGRTARAS